MIYDNDDYEPMEVGDNNSFIEQLNGKIDAYYLLRRLPPRQKEIVILKAQGYRYREIADQLGITTGTVSNTFWKIRRKINPI